jgi:hypothetical protein
MIDHGPRIFATQHDPAPLQLLRTGFDHPRRSGLRLRGEPLEPGIFIRGEHAVDAAGQRQHGVVKSTQVTADQTMDLLFGIIVCFQSTRRPMFGARIEQLRRRTESPLRA